MGRRIKGILFDLGDTIVDFGDVDIPRAFRAGAKLVYGYLKSLDLPLPPFRRFHKGQFWAIQWRYTLSKIVHRDFNSLEVMAHLGDKMGHNLSDKQSFEQSWRWYSPLADIATVEDGLSSLLQSFRDSGLVLGLVSNTFISGRVLDRHLDQLGLLGFFETRIYSSETVFRKPNRRIFELALRKAGLEADETLFVGDSLRADIRGANRAGLISVLKDPRGKHRHSRIKPRHRIEKLCELVEIVNSHTSAT